ncbi:hypothetical protein [Luteimonas granuli]|uniref:hypothetical protein n=1 Tax=Luteimonas granuli TaxID=1176533 RepID=UPI00143DCE18|nr:hypothetical protein [Luteimonas granuli]
MPVSDTITLLLPAAARLGRQRLSAAGARRSAAATAWTMARREGGRSCCGTSR